MSVFKLAIVCLEAGQVGLSLEADIVKLGGKRIEWAEGRHVEEQRISPPELTFERALCWDRVHPLLGEFGRPGLWPERRHVEFWKPL